MTLKKKVASQAGSFQMAFKEVKVLDNGKVRIKGFASTPDIDRYDDIVKPEAFAGAMALYMKNPVILLGHNSDDVLGQVIEYNLSVKGLEITAELSNDINNTFKNITDKNLRGFSIGFICKACTYREEGNKTIREITELDLIEISVVSTPANPAALFGLSKSLKLIFAEMEKKEADDGIDTDEQIVDEEKAEEETKEEETTEEVKEEEKTTEDEKTDEAPSEEQTKEDPKTGDETTSGENPDTSEKEDEAPDGEKADIVKADEKPTEEPVKIGLTEDEVKALIEEATKSLREANDTLTAQNLELKDALGLLQNSHKQLEDDVLSISVSKGVSTKVSRKGITWDILDRK